LITFIAAIFIRGGVTGLPQSVISAFKIGDSQQAIITMNGSYSVIYGILNSSKEVQRLRVSLPEGVSVNDTMKELYPAISFDATGEKEKKYNLIFVFMEGWPAEVMASYGYDQKITPFFDSIVEKSLAPLGIIAGGRRTTEGLFTTLCSQQNPLGETVAQSSLQNFTYICLPEILKNKGWSTAFFQGSHKETSGTGAFAQSMGFVESYAKEDMPEGRYKRNFWGAHDPDIYDFAIEKIDAMQEPFLVGINTNSTHDTRLPKGVKPFFEKDKSRDKKRDVLYFADQAMREFFEKLKDKPYYENTVFVFMSDHTSGRRNSNFSKYLIPGAIYAEGLVPVKRLNHFVSQRDIAPTVLDILDLPPSASFSGKSFYVSAENKPANTVFFSDYYDSGSIGWVSGHKIVETNINHPDTMSCYSIDADKMVITSERCNAQSKKLSEQALQFTSYSQDRLFKGETKQFYKFLSE
jgi:phosphoglycerol transferase MdoB-like AlkP superfamily enzyme